jgi:hypothetical protein
MSPLVRRSAYPASVGMRVEEIKVACDGGKRSCSGDNVVTGFAGDFIKHVDEIYCSKRMTHVELDALERY